jgi:aminoglycoside phosphotransferase (APT) family kinase protein
MKEFEQIAQIIFPQGKLKRAWPLPGGLSAGMTALEVERANGRRGRQPSNHKLIIRSHQHPAVAENEFRLLQQISSLDLAAPAPYHLDLSGRILAAPYLVIGYSEGEMVFAPADLDDHVRQMAAQLAKIHRVNDGIVDLSFLPQTGWGCAELARPLTSPDSPFDEARIRAALAAAGPLPPGNAAALLHGDFWPGNSLWQNGRLTAVIDWEDAQLGDPLIDLAQSRSEIVWIFGVEAMDAFTRHYQSLNDLDYRHLPYWDLCAALRFLRLAGGDLAGFAAYFGGYGRADITEYTIHEYVGFFITQALAKLAVEE